MALRGGIEGQPIAPGLMSRALAAVGAAARGFTQGWFSPGTPIPSAVPAGTEQPRVWEYQPGYNAIPRGKSQTGSGVSFAQLQAFSRNCDIVAIAIQTVKDQMSQQKWTIRPKQLRDESVSDMKKKMADPRIDALTEFFEMPDRRHSWRRWMRQLLDQILIYDAPALYVRRNLAGGVYAIEVIDGQTIRPLIDDLGRIYAYQQWVYGMPGETMTPAELLYLPSNPSPDRVYGLSQTEQIVMTINTLLRRNLSQLSFYTDGTMPEGFIQAAKGWGPKQIQEFQERFDAYLTGNQAARSRLTVIPEGAAPIFPKTAVLKDEFDELLISVVCYAFSISRSNLIKPMNRASSQQGQEQAQDEGLEPRKIEMAEIANTIMAQVFGVTDLEFAWEQHRSVKPELQAEIDKAYISCGVYSINDVRERMGEEDIPGGDTYGFLTASSFVPLEQAIAPPPENPEPMPGQKLIGDGSDAAKASLLRDLRKAARRENDRNWYGRPDQG